MVAPPMACSEPSTRPCQAPATPLRTSLTSTDCRATMSRTGRTTSRNLLIRAARMVLEKIRALGTATRTSCWPLLSTSYSHRSRRVTLLAALRRATCKLSLESLKASMSRCAPKCRLAQRRGSSCRRVNTILTSIACSSRDSISRRRTLCSRTVTL